MAEELAQHIQNGYQSVKVGFGKKGQADLGIDEDRDIAFARRELLARPCSVFSHA